jgi:hypothetical protein
MKIRRLISFSAIAIVIIHVSTSSGCSKEYSCEGCSTKDTLLPIDTTIIEDTVKIDNTIKFPVCSTCDTTQAYTLNRWGFRNYQSAICGNVYYTGLDSGYAVAIRGFLDCAKDTQFVITGRFLPKTFEADQLNVTASYSNFLLYAPNNVILAVSGSIINGTPLTMNMVLDTFNHSTGMASFRFFGYAYTNKGGSSYIPGDSSYISDGRIKVKIK